MFMWGVVQFCLLVVIGVFMVTQVILPPFINRPFFFSFRKSERRTGEVENDLAVARDELDQGMLKAESKLIRKEVRDLAEAAEASVEANRKSKRRRR